MKRTLLLFLLLFPYIISLSQYIPVHHTNSSIYDYLDELTNHKIISINTAIKPLSRTEILATLKIADSKKETLNARQRKDLEFYLKIYDFDDNRKINPYSKHDRLNLFKKSDHFFAGLNHFGLFYKDSFITMSIKPIFGINYFITSSEKSRYTYGGLDAYMTVGKHFGFYANLRENNMTELMNSPNHFVQSEGGNYKIDAEGINAITYSEMRGGLTYKWDWGSIGFVKDHLQWGHHYNGANIFSGRTPSFPMLKLDISPIKWFDFHYFHGWLVSEVVDSSRSYITSNGDFRAIYFDKYIAANLFTFKIFKFVDFSFGNSIIYSDENVKAAYFIPFLFYKSVDHTLNYGIDNQNSQMFFGLSSRLIKYTHLYADIFIDDFSVTRISDKDRHNFAGSKIGLKVSNWPLNNVSITGEYTRTNPVVYKHRIETLSFESNKYNLGHYLRDNSDEWYLELALKPYRSMRLSISYVHARHGNEYKYIDGLEAEYYPFMNELTWESRQIIMRFQYEFIPEAYIYMNYTLSSTKGYDVDGKSSGYYLELYTPKYLQGNRNIFSLGINFGF